MKIYFAASISGGRDNAHLYPQIVEELKKHGTVLSEQFADQSLTKEGEGDEYKFIHDRDMNWLLAADVTVAEVTTPSLGVGYELGRALEQKKPVLCLFYIPAKQRISPMIMGANYYITKGYSDISEIKQILKEFFEDEIHTFR